MRCGMPYSLAGSRSQSGSISAEYLVVFPALIAALGICLTVITTDIVITREAITSLERTYKKSLGIGISYKWFCEEYCVPARW